jgi:hypothetical protein
MHNRKERPRYRTRIEMERWRPFVEDGSWNSITVIDPNGNRCTLSGPLLIQARKMASEGYWGPLSGRSRAWFPQPRPVAARSDFEKVIRRIVERARRNRVLE